MDSKIFSKVDRSFKDQASAFNHLMNTAPVGSLEKILTYLGMFYNFKKDIHKTFEGILNYHLTHMTVIRNKDSCILLTSASIVRSSGLPIKASNMIKKVFEVDKPNVSDLYNPLIEKHSSVKKELAHNLLERFGSLKFFGK